MYCKLFVAAAYSAAFPGLNSMMSPLSHLPEGLKLDPYRNLMDRMKEAGREGEEDGEGGGRDSLTGDRDTRSEPGPVPPELRKDLGPMPFSILPPHMLNMMERMKGEGAEAGREAEQREGSPMNLSSERDIQERKSDER